MNASLTHEDDVDELSLTVRVPRDLPLGIAESLEESLAKAIEILTISNAFRDISKSADDVARIVVTQVRPSGIMLEDRIAQMTTVRTVFEEGDWLTAEDINKLQRKPSSKTSLPASDWKRRGRIFSVSYDGKEYYPRYQFDAMYQPLPIISDIIKAFGEYADAWSLATWFHFPNGWIAKDVGGTALPVAPKDALNRARDVIKAAQNQKGTYVA
jgi:hypothetical protein